MPVGGGGQRRVALVAGSLLAALLVLGAGVFAVLRDSDTDGTRGADGARTASPTPPSAKPVSIEAEEHFRIPAPEIGDESFRTPGAWLTSGYYATGEKESVAGYDVESGKRAWRIELSGPLCAASRDVTRGGLVAVVFHNAKRSENSTCTRLAVIDVVKGTKVWEKPLADSVQRGLGLTVAISDTAVAAGWPGGSTAYAPSTGALLWDAPTKGCAQEEHLGGPEVADPGLLQDCRWDAVPRWGTQP